MVSRKFREVYGAIRVLPKIFIRNFSSEKNVVPVFRKAAEHRHKVAIRDDFGKYTYKDLLNASVRLSKQIQEHLDGRTQERVGLLCPNNASYVIAQWACWISGQIVVPLSTSHPESILHYLLTDSQSGLLISIPQHEQLTKELCSKTHSKSLIMDPSIRESAMMKTDNSDAKPTEKYSVDFAKIGQSGNFYSTKDAMIIYTSGSTGLPKGVVLSHLNVDSQVKSMIESWHWEDKDCMLHALPLHHIHGIVNALITPLYVGAKCVMLKDFDVNRIWAELIGVKIPLLDRVSVFTGVPTMYAKLIQEYDTKLNKSNRIAEHIRQTCSQKIRLMMSGSAPLNRSIFDRWYEVTGHQLVERYGMTETGMILSAPLLKRKKPGNVGAPMPGVKVRLISDERDGSKKVALIGSDKGIEVIGRPSVVGGSQTISIGDIKANNENVVGVLHVKGDTVTTRYWNKPQATASSLKTGWFNTGDIVEYGPDGNFTVLGRVASDIIKTGGYKVSAIQVETVLSEHESISDVAVVPLEDPVWGEKIGILVVLKEGQNLDLSKLKAWASKKLPEYALPRVIIEAPHGVIPRNHMGKVNRHQLREAFFLQPPQQSPQQTASASG